VLVWKDTVHFDSPTSVRFFWIDDHILKEKELQLANEYNEYPFMNVKRYNCTSPGIKAAYDEVTPYIKDGLLFYHKEAGYLSGLNPYVISWKDSFCCLYPIDTDDGMIDSEIKAVLELGEGGKLQTKEGIVLAELPKEVKKKNKWFRGNLIRVKLGNIKIIDFADDVKDSIRVTDVTVLKRSCFKKAQCDSISRIIFQYLMRNSPITISHIINSVQIYEQLDLVDKISA